jgi:hypothetical protein
MPSEMVLTNVVTPLVSKGLIVPQLSPPAQLTQFGLKLGPEKDLAVAEGHRLLFGGVLIHKWKLVI